MRTAAPRPTRTREERDRLVEQYLPLVRYVVARMPVSLPGSLAREDLFSVGIMGLMHAAATYDAARGASFKTFAYTAIRGSILDEIRKHDPVPRNRRDRLRRIERASGALHARHDRPPTLEEIAEHLGLAAAELEGDLLALHTCKTLSIDDRPPSGDEEGSSLTHALCDVDAPDPADEVTRHEDVDRLARAVSELPETERHVVVLYHYENLYLKEIGTLLGVTESRVSQILTSATARLRLKMKTSD